MVDYAEMDSILIISKLFKNKISKIEIYDLFAKNLLVKQKENLNRVNVTQLVSGVYIVKIFSREMIEIKRIIKR